MPNLSDRLRNIQSLRDSIESKGKLPDDVLRKIEYKFRLECNYNSNKIEGGTLTKPETRSVMIGNITVEGKPLKDIREMKGHDIAMQDILHIGYGEKRISEKRIKDIHRQIIVPETPEEEKEIGVWKQNGNHIFNYREEKFQFTPPNEVPEAVHDLLNWLNTGLDKIQSKQKDAPHPLLLAFEFHTKYLTIHPFTDGNGRTARILTNLILVSLGYPPFWVTEGGEKDAYNRYLADVQAYGGSPDLLYEFLAGLVERSLQLTLDAVEGREIEDVDDWAKKLHLLKTSLPSEDSLKESRTRASTDAVFQQSIKATVRTLIEKLQAYDVLFVTKKMWFSIGSSGTSVEAVDQLDSIMPNYNYQAYEKLAFSYSLEGYKKDSSNPFSLRCKVIWILKEYEYSCYVEGGNKGDQYQKQYDKFYSPDEIGDIVSQCGEILYQQLATQVQQ
jgi:Fic family protein